jgi:hypothetical protein
MRGLCVISYGQIQMTDVVGAYLLAVLATLSDRYCIICFLTFFFHLLSSNLFINTFVSPGYIRAVQSYEQSQTCSSGSSISYGGI